MLFCRSRQDLRDCVSISMLLVQTEELARTDIPSNAYGEAPLFEVAALYNRHLAAEKGTWAVQDLV